MPKASEHGFFDYLKAAFHRRSRLPGLGHLPLNWALVGAFAVLGLANPGFWFLGGAVEAAYLFLRGSSARFQKLIDGERLLAAQGNQQERIQRAVARLDRDSRARYHRLLARCREVVGITEALDEDRVESLKRMRTGGLTQLLWIFLRLLTSRDVLVQAIAQTDRAALQGEAERLEAQLAKENESSSLAHSLRSSVEIQKKRLENFDRAAENLRVLDAELDRIEQQVALIREETAVSGKAQILSERLDVVTGALAETNRWMEQNSDLFAGLEGLQPLESDALPELPPPLPERE